MVPTSSQPIRANRDPLARQSVGTMGNSPAIAGWQGKTLDGINDRIASILKDRQCLIVVFEFRRKMKLYRQIDVAELLVGANSNSVA